MSSGAELGAGTPNSETDIVEKFTAETKKNNGSSIECCNRKCDGLAIIAIILCTVFSLVIGGIVGYIIGDSNTDNSSSTCDDDFTFPTWDYGTDTLNESLYGQWELVIPVNGSPTYGPLTGAQFVHVVLLPSGKLLITPGSSLHASSHDLETWPFHRPWPPKPFTFVNTWNDTGLFDIGNISNYYQTVNFNSIYDIESNKWNRIPHPIPPVDRNNNNETFIGNDLFCTGQLQLRDGNVFYDGGTEYYPEPWFTGPKTMYIFNWTHELLQNWDTFDWTEMPSDIDGFSANEEYYPWMYVGEMEAGRWYPRSVELLDGRFVIFSGTINWDDMYYNTQARRLH